MGPAAPHQLIQADSRAEKKQVGGQTGCDCMCACVRACIYILHSEKQKKKSSVMHLEKKCRKRPTGWEDATCHSAGDAGHQESSAMPAGEQGSGSLVTGSQHVARPAGSKHLAISLWTSQREPGREQRAGGWGGSQAGYLAAALGSACRETSLHGAVKRAVCFFLCCLRVVHTV